MAEQAWTRNDWVWIGYWFFVFSSVGIVFATYIRSILRVALLQIRWASFNSVREGITVSWDSLRSGQVYGLVTHMTALLSEENKIDDS